MLRCFTDCVQMTSESYAPVTYVSSKPAPRFDAGVLSGWTSRLCEGEAEGKAECEVKATLKVATSTTRAEKAITQPT